ncbi:MAG: hypothetical protein C0490_03525, partial [Marivirga sp.]|nr:hypothetical protein [Marivirga sp.]
MNKLHLPFILTVLFITHFNPHLQAGNPERFQPGYVIVTGDTIKGFILLVRDHFLSTKQCVFKEKAEGVERTYSPDDLIAYGVDGENFFYAATIPNENSGTTKVFLSCLVRSDISLFFYRNRFFVNGENGIEELTEVKTEVVRNGRTFNEKRPLFKSVLQKQMNGCSTIHEKLIDTKLTENSLVSLFKDYATCVGRELTEFDSKNHETSRTRYGFTVGLLATDVILKGSTT